MVTEQERELEQALKEYVEDAGGELGPPPAAEELELYRAGGLEPAEEERVRDHLTLDPASRVLFQALAGQGLSAGPALGGPEVDQETAWHALEQRLDREGRVLKLPRRAAPAGAASGRAPLYLVAASLLAATVALGVWGLGLQHKVEKLARPQATALLELFPEQPERGEPAPGSALVDAAPGSTSFALVLHCNAHRAFETYSVEIVDAQGDSQWRGDRLVESEHGTFNMFVPKRFLKPGEYRIRLLGWENGEDQVIEEYPLQVKRY